MFLDTSEKFKQIFRPKLESGTSLHADVFEDLTSACENKIINNSMHATNITNFATIIEQARDAVASLHVS